jgi:putative membrane protein
MIEPILKKDDKKAKTIIGLLSVVVFLVVLSLGKFKLLNVDLGFNPHVFATISATINSMVAVLLIAGLYFIKTKNIVAHKKCMLIAIVFSSLFLVSYILHHLFTVDTHYGGEGIMKYIYYVILITHIPLAALILPFILMTAYKALVADVPAHKKIARITFPIWLYVAISGVVVYLMINPYYN